MIEELQQTTGGGYARQMIQRIIQGYKETGLASDNPFQELKDLLDLFFQNQEVNNFTTMICGSDLCEMLGLFHDLTEASVCVNLEKINMLEKYKVAYNNRVRRDQKKEVEEKKEQNRQEEENDELAELR